MRSCIALCLCVALTCGAQPSTPPLFSIDDIDKRCVAIGGYPVAVESTECNVVDFGSIATVDGYSFFYARYRITAEVPFWPGLRDRQPNANALAIFVGQDGSDYVSIYRLYHEDFSDFAPYEFSIPSTLETPLGKVLHIERRSNGSGMQQWLNDEYWLWRWNDWQRLDVTSWYDRISAYLPSGYAAGGVSPAHFDLINLQSISPVRRMDDAQCCPSGGIVTVKFEWVDLALTIREARYDPDTDFRSLFE